MKTIQWSEPNGPCNDRLRRNRSVPHGFLQRVDLKATGALVGVRIGYNSNTMRPKLCEQDTNFSARPTQHLGHSGMGPLERKRKCLGLPYAVRETKPQFTGITKPIDRPKSTCVKEPGRCSPPACDSVAPSPRSCKYEKNAVDPIADASDGGAQNSFSRYETTSEPIVNIPQVMCGKQFTYDRYAATSQGTCR